jgi:hypothetical protein
MPGAFDSTILNPFIMHKTFKMRINFVINLYAWQIFLNDYSTAYATFFNFNFVFKIHRILLYRTIFHLLCDMSKTILLIAYWIHFKVHKFSTGESNDNLTLVHCTFNNSLFAGCFPLIHTLICTDVTDTIWVYLEK